MNTHMLKGKWRQIRGVVTEQLGNITDRDLVKIVGKREQLVGLVQEKYGYTKAKAEKDVDYLLKKMNLRPANKTSSMGFVAVLIGSLLTIATFGALARRLASAGGDELEIWQ